jgi:hypothetical protein
MKVSRFAPVFMVGAVMMGSAFAADASPATSTTLSKDQVAAIQKECSKANGGSMTSKAYQDCVKAKESAAAAKATH